MNRRQAPINKKFNRLTVLKEVESVSKEYNGKKSIQRFVRCKCDCGKIIVTRLLMVIHGKAKSCGCLTRENDRYNLNTSTHGHSKDRIYQVYHNMIRRCYDKNVAAYKDYGGRGITVCREWRNSFVCFYNWAMANGYKDDLQLERKNNDKGYSPSNCTFTTKQSQARNRRTSVRFNINGHYYLQCDLAKMFNVSPNTIQYHRQLGKTGMQIFNHFNNKV